MTLLILAVILAALGVILVLIPFHVATTGVCFLALAAVLTVLYLLRDKPKARTLRVVLTSLTFAGVLVMLGCVGYIGLSGRDDDVSGGAPEFVVVLGAQTHGDRPSRTLRERLDLAYDYLMEHPDAVCFVTGGQGRDETYTEAYVMHKYLLEKGVDENRVVMESAAHNTRENLIFSRELARNMGVDTESVLIITSEFHLCRAKYIAGTLNMRAYGLGSTTTPWVLKVCYELREVFAFVKAFAQAG